MTGVGQLRRWCFIKCENKCTGPGINMENKPPGAGPSALSAEEEPFDHPPQSGEDRGSRFEGYDATGRVSLHGDDPTENLSQRDGRISQLRMIRSRDDVCAPRTLLQSNDPMDEGNAAGRHVKDNIVHLQGGRINRLDCDDIAIVNRGAHARSRHAEAQRPTTRQLKSRVLQQSW